MSHKHLFHIFTTSNTSCVRLEIFMQLIAAKAKIRWNNKRSSIFYETRCIIAHSSVSKS